MIEELRRDAAARQGLTESTAYQVATLTAADAEAARSAILSDPTFGSYLVLMALQRDAPDHAQRLPIQTVAQVLAGAMAELVFLNDFGYLSPGGSSDGPAGAFLRSTGPAARPALAPLLSDQRPAELWGGEESTLSYLYAYRRCDFAYRFLLLAQGSDPVFDAEPSRRDQRIDELLRSDPAFDGPV